ncbi:MAG: type II toxin-antitoxin system mRNA interferase toxin, RelE/StbE family [Elusimicrobia bacterium HGW-Elusimicrobia-1]|nr:MAG: type II toxin-antitoxin system mRNA interferase toxin, RelE/StbE family [Elusimicrobia bacterium HGW-Elusimicrobia-1]
MRKYKVVFLPPAEKQLARIGNVEARCVLEKLRWLSENFERIAPESLTAGLKGFLKLRVGDVRVIYTAEKETRKIRVHLIGHRREIYK